MLKAFEKDENWKVSDLLAEGLSSNATYHVDNTKHGSLGQGSTLLHWASAFDALDCVKVHHVCLLDASGDTDPVCVKVLVEHEADIHQMNERLMTPLHVAATYGSAAVAKVSCEQSPVFLDQNASSNRLMFFETRVTVCPGRAYNLFSPMLRMWIFTRMLCTVAFTGLWIEVECGHSG